MNRLFLGLTMICVILVNNVAIVMANPQIILIGKGDSNYPPYQYEEEGKLLGICPDLINEAAKIIGVKTKYQKYPWKRMLLSAKDGEIDAVMPLFKTTDRQKYLFFPKNELVDEENAFFASKNSAIAYTGKISDLSPYQVGVVRGYSYGKEFDNFKLPKKIAAKNDPTFVRMFAENRFQVGVGSIYVVTFFAKEIGIFENIVFLKPKYFSPTPLFIGFSKKKSTQEIADAFSSALQMLSNNGFKKKILARYGIGHDQQ